MNEAGLIELCYVSGILLLVSNLWFFFRVLRPLKRLSLQAEQIQQGNFDSFEHRCGGIPEISELQRTMAGMARHIRRTQEQSHAYTDQLDEAQERERKRIARELHDDTLQSLIAINQGIDLAKSWLQSDPQHTTQMLQLAREQVVGTVTNLRNLIGGLRPPALEELGLVAALKMEVEKITDLTIAINVQGVARRLSESRELALFRAVQEVVTNTRRHSAATEAEIAVSYRPEGVILRIMDNGCGFTPPSHLSDLALKKHYGLIGLQERVHNLGGTIGIDSAVGSGTTIEVFLPSRESGQPDYLVRDPVCSALIESQQAYDSAMYGGKTYYFCCPVCQGAFRKDPLLYLTNSPLLEISPHH